MPSKPKSRETSEQQALVAQNADEIRNRADHARRLLEDPLLVEAFEKLDAAYERAWRDSGHADVEGRERAWIMIWANEQVQKQLREVVNSGKLLASRVKTTLDEGGK